MQKGAGEQNPQKQTKRKSSSESKFQQILQLVPKIFSNQPALPFTFHSVSEVAQDNLFDLVLAHVKPCTFDNFFQLKTRQRLGARFWLDTARPNKATGQV